MSIVEAQGLSEDLVGRVIRDVRLAAAPPRERGPAT